MSILSSPRFVKAINPAIAGPLAHSFRLESRRNQKGGVEVQCAEIRRGSIEAVRKGIIAFVDDIKRANPRIRRMIEEHFNAGKSKKHRLSRKEWRMDSQLIILDAVTNPNVPDLRQQFDELWKDPLIIIVFLLGVGEGYDQIARDLDDVACNHPARRGVWLKQPDKIVPDLISKLRHDDPLNVMCSVGFKRRIGSWRTVEKARLIDEIDAAFSEAV